MLAISCSITALAQPVINNGNNMPPVGYSDTVSVVLSGVNPGMGGANATWNFSTLTPMAGGKFTIVNPANTPYASNFPSATNGIELSPFTGGSSFEYYKVSSSKWEVVGGNITGSSGDDDTANPKTMIPFPFAYNDMVTDTFTKQNGTHTVDITYDGYGTLTTPYATYANVVRVKREFGGSDYYYDWFTTTPYLMIVATYDNNNGRLTFIGKTLINSVGNGPSVNATVTVAPNPVRSFASIRIGSVSSISGKVIISDMTGAVIAELGIRNNEVKFSREGIAAGLYSYSVMTEKGSVAKGSFLID